MFKIEFSLPGWIDTLEEPYLRQIPFAASLAINDLAKQGQTGEKEGMRARFVIRREWVLWGIKTTRSNKNQRPMRSSVWIDRGEGGRREFLYKFEQGTPKTPKFGSGIAVPGPGLGLTKGGNIPANMRPTKFNLQPSHSTHAKGSRRTFTMPSADGTYRIMQRVGPGKGAYKTLYTVKPMVRTPALLQFYKTVQTIASSNFAAAFEKAMAFAISTAK